MSKRFGRNQKRRLRAEIDYLQRAIIRENVKAAEKIQQRDDAIAALRAGDWYRAEGKHADLADLTLHITAHEITEGVDQRGRRFRKADITAHCEYAQLHALHDRNWKNDRNGITTSYRPSVVEWNGATWYLKEVQVSHADRYGGDRYFDQTPACTIILEGLAPPASQKRSPLQYLFGRERPDEVEALAVSGPQFYRADSRPVMRIE